jgi:hypothetical protein
VLRQLGAPAAWSGTGSPAELLAPLVRAAAARARGIARAEPDADVEIATAAAPLRAGRGAQRAGSTMPAKATTAKRTQRRSAARRPPT